MSISAYLPQDRSRALANNTTLHEQTTGAALFADISGFTPLTEALRASLGARQGAEELTKRLGAVFTVLIAEVERYGGSVISFAGDAITCWFDDELENSSFRAAACALALQQAMKEFPALGLKVSVATGAAQRLAVGDPAVQRFDVLAGETLVRMAAGEDVCETGEALADEATVQAVGDALMIHEWRVDGDTQNRFGVLDTITAPETALVSQIKIENLNAEKLREWLPAWIYARESAGQTAFFNEFRTVTFVFVRFSGIDYDGELASAQLDAYIRWVQRVVQQADGYLRAPIIGDKGSYLLIACGAPVAHEDDTRRALRLALTLLSPPADYDFIAATQIGIATGVAWVGLYGGATRLSYDFIGDEVNLAARLMQAAAPHEILVSGRVQSKLADIFTFGEERLLKLKGKSGELPIFAALEESRRRGIRVQEPVYYLPMVGREAELQQIADRLDLTVQGHSQVIGIVAEAGLGKSRLAAEGIRSAQRKGFVGYGGACQSDGIHTPYLVWKSVWQAFFNLDPKAPLDAQTQDLMKKVAHYAPHRVAAIPLLNVVLDLHIPENNFTENLEPKIRQSALHALLEDCLKAAVGEAPLLLVIEDLHWIDALSHELLEQLAKALTNYPVCFLLAYRPPELARLQEVRLEALAQFTQIELHELGQAESGQIVRAKLAQFFGENVIIPPIFAEKLLERAQGNPFYLEELLNYLHDRGVDLQNLDALEKLELPDSLHSLILSRIDRLLEHEKITLKVASIVGRLFKADWLRGYYPDLGDAAQVKNNLSELAQLDITPLDTPEPELAYLFKHIITHEVTYESLPYATRAKLHEQLAAYLEQTYPDVLPLETLAFHYEHSNNTAKKIEYLRKAGEAAQQNFANAAALEYYGKLLLLLTDDDERAPLHLKRGEVLELLGDWNEAESEYRAALETATAQDALHATAQFALGRLYRLRGEYAPALDWLSQAQETHTHLNDPVGLAQVLVESSSLWENKSDYDQARAIAQTGLALARQASNALTEAQALTSLGQVAFDQGDYAVAQTLYAESLAIWRANENKRGTATALNDLAKISAIQGDYATGRALFEESLETRRAIGDKQGMAGSLNNLAIVAGRQGDYARALILHQESLDLKRELGDKAGVASSLHNLGIVESDQGHHVAARAWFEQSLALGRELGDKIGIASAINSLGEVASDQDDHTEAQKLYSESLALRREIGDKWGIATTTLNLGFTAYALNDYRAAHALFAESLSLAQELDDQPDIASVQLGLGMVALAQHTPNARLYLLDSLRTSQQIGSPPKESASLLVGIAGLALQEGNLHFAAQLLGAAEAAFNTLKVVIAPRVKPLHEQTLAKTKEALGEAAFQAAWEEGSAWSLEEAVTKALEENA